ncbi:hypothetical protein LSAT2_022544 [Lamellibrachia satsuma]|nr:hypothetical protein LSAT2_022544 [Lamellibrachia satsuma]
MASKNLGDPAGLSPGGDTYQHGTGGKPSGVMQQPEVVLQVIPVGQDAVQMVCPYCHAQILTTVNFKTGTLTWVISLVVCVVGCIPCCLIPFCVNGCKDVVHTCPSCNRMIGVYKPL